MADVAQGLVSGGGDPPLDVFEAAMEAKGVTGGGSSTTPSVASGLTFGGSQEAPATAEAATAEEPGTTTEEAAPLHDDPDIADYLARFDGDADKALKSAVEAQKALGRQGNELGELRQTVAKLEGMVEVIQSQPAAPAAPAVSMTPDQIENAILEQDGLTIATWAANEAPHLLDSVLSKWGEDEPYNALVFRQEYNDWKATTAAPATTAEPSRADRYVHDQLEAQRMTSSMDVVAGEFPETYDAFKDLLPEALKQVPRAVQKLVISADDGEQQDALRVVFEKAQSLHTAALAVDARQAVAARTSVAKSAARVTSGALQVKPGTVEESATTTREEEVAKFKASILSAETTSVSDGLTFGK